MARQFHKTILHIGLHKTGTTTIQAGLFKNRKSLARECGVFYPAWKANHSGNLFAMFCNPRSRKPNGLQADQARQQCETALAAGTEKTMLLSGEDMSHLFVDGVRRLQDWLSEWSDECQVIAVVRDPLEWSRSNVQQRVQGGMILDKLMERPQLQRVAPKLERYISVFGRERLTVLHFSDLSASPDGLFVDFCEVAHIPRAWSREIKIARQNVSLSAEAIDCLSVRNVQAVAGAQPPSAEDIAQLSQWPGTRYELPEHIREAVIESSVEDAEFLRLNFGLELQRSARASPHS